MRLMQIRCVRGEFHHSVVGIMLENSREQLSCTAVSITICMHSPILHAWSSLEHPSVNFNAFGATLPWEMATDGQLPDARFYMTALAPVVAPWSDMNQTKAFCVTKETHSNRWRSPITYKFKWIMCLLTTTQRSSLYSQTAPVFIVPAKQILTLMLISLSASVEKL